MDFSKINELKPYDLNCNIFDVYNYDGLSMQELLCQFFTKINECIKTSNETINLAEWLVNEGLKQEVAIKLTNWLNDGTLEDLINITLFENLNKKIDNVSSQLEQIVINVKNYGAKGDGITDDTDSLIQAIRKSNNGEIFMPRGTYRITKSIEINNINNISINGNNSTILCDTVESGIIVSDILKNFTLKNINIVSSYNSSYGIKLSNVHHSSLNNVWVQGFNLDGLYVEGCYISTYNNVTSIENKRYGVNFDSDMVDPCNNSIRINDCNFSKNGMYNLNIKAHYVYTINGLNAEQFDYIECGGVPVYTKGSINIENANAISINGLYVESYMRTPGINNFIENYSIINLGTSDRSVENITIDNFYLSNNNNNRVAIRLNKVRQVEINNGEIKGSNKGIENVDANNTVTVSPNCKFYNNNMSVDSDKKYISCKQDYNYDHVISKVDIKGDNVILMKCKQNTYLKRILIYYLTNSNNYASHELKVKVNDREFKINLLANKTPIFAQSLNIDYYAGNGDVVYLSIEENSNATGSLSVVLEKIDVL